jgi:hypothetical protein
MKDAATIYERLSQPLDMTRVKRRQAPGKGTVPFLEGHDVIKTANEIFEFCWSFDLLSEPKVMIWDQILTLWDQQMRERVPVVNPETGQPRTERVGMVYVIGKVTVELEGKTYTHSDVGRLSFTGDTPEALDTALSGAATDCLKRCFRQLGEQFGLTLYEKGTTKSVGVDSPSGKKARGNGHDQVAVAESIHSNNGEVVLSVDQARAVLCPVGSNLNPQWAGMPLGQVMNQPNGEKMLMYLAGEKFKADGDNTRKQAKIAAKIILKQTGE